MTTEIPVDQLEMIKADLSKYSKFQWIKSERVSQVCQLKDVVGERGLIFVEFQDGSRINYALMDEYILKVGSDSELLDISGEPIPATQAQAKIKPSATVTPIKKESPIYALLRKQKPNVQNVDISVQLNLPTMELYKVLLGSFENSEKEIVDYIVADLDVEVIKGAIKEAITKYYE
jgi:hypothetical protein